MTAPKGSAPRGSGDLEPGLRRFFAPGTPASAEATPGGSGGSPADVDELVEPLGHPGRAAAVDVATAAAAEPVAGLGKDELIARHGLDKALRMCEKTRNLAIFSNLVINDIMAVTIRVFQPTGPAGMDVTAWQLVPAGEAGVRLRRRLDSFLTFLGPGGFATPDDVRSHRVVPAGIPLGRRRWSDLSRGMHREPRGNDELQMRSFWRRWQSLVAGTPYVEQYERGLTPGAVPETTPSPELTAAAD